jgi:hypothetical protein
MANMALEVAKLRIEVNALLAENPPKSLKSGKKTGVIIYPEEEVAIQSAYVSARRIKIPNHQEGRCPRQSNSLLR